jgi:hypothetical protein
MTELAPAKPSDDVVANEMSRRGGSAPPLTGISNTPLVLQDGRVIDQAGYDPTTGVYFDIADGAFPPIRSYLTEFTAENCPSESTTDTEFVAMERYEAERELAQRQAARCYDYLANDFLGEFVFEEAVDEAAAVALLFTAVSRPAIATAPGFLVSASAMGSGKTTLARAIVTAAAGASPPDHDFPEHEEELAKLQFSEARAGTRNLLLDNVRGGRVINSPSLAKLLTSERVQGRILGKSESASATANMTVILTGNNVMLEGDMPSRIVEVRLAVETERPETREFARPDLVEWARENRGRIVHAVLSMQKAYLDAGAPPVGGKPSRFPEWDLMVRRPIIWAGGADIGAKFESAYRHDPELAQLREFLGLWRHAIGTEPVTIGELIDAINGAADFSAGRDKFRSALVSLTGERRGNFEPRSLGIRLKKHTGRPVGGLRLRSNFDGHRKQLVWSVTEEAE